MYLHVHIRFIQTSLVHGNVISNLALVMANLRQTRRIDDEEMNSWVGMLEAGCSKRHVAGVLGVSMSTVARMWRRFQTYGHVTHRHGGGRQRSTTHRENRLIAVQSRRQRFIVLFLELENELDIFFKTFICLQILSD